MTTENWTPVNKNSTCEWVDESYSKRLWGQLLRRAENVPPASLRSFWAVRRHAVHEWHNSKDHYRVVYIFVPAANHALELVMMQYDRNGQLKHSGRLLRITQHAGQRLFERLRTNSVDDVFDTLCGAVWAFLQHDAISATEFQGVKQRVVLPHGTLHVVADGDLWVATTFIPVKPE